MKKEYQHFVQKAATKYWKQDDNKIKYCYFKFDKKIVINEHDYNSYAKNHPIAEKFFYNEEIESGLNKIERNYIELIDNKITKYKKMNYQDIVINRKDLFTLKIYFYINLIRTKKSRRNIENLEGDFLFNEINKKWMRKYNLSPKEIQLEKIKAMLEIYNLYLEEFNIDFFTQKMENLIMSKKIKEIWKH